MSIWHILSLNLSSRLVVRLSMGVMVNSVYGVLAGKSPVFTSAPNAPLPTLTRFWPKVVQIGPKWENLGFFSDQIQYIWRGVPK